MHNSCSWSLASFIFFAIQLQYYMYLHTCNAPLYVYIYMYTCMSSFSNLNIFVYVKLCFNLCKLYFNINSVKLYTGRCLLLRNKMKNQMSTGLNSQHSKRFYLFNLKHTDKICVIFLWVNIFMDTYQLINQYRNATQLILSFLYQKRKKR